MSPPRQSNPDEQYHLPYGPTFNSELFSNYWLGKRLPLEPEWISLRNDAQECLERLLDLWSRQKQRVERYGDEAGLEEGFIQPVLSCLGWKIKYQTYLQSREPDYALFLSDHDLDLALSAGRTSPDFWRYPVALADAKAWHLALDRPTHGVRREYPPEQLEWYLDRSRLDWGMLTNGSLWRLVPRELPPGRPRFKTYFQVDLPSLLARFDAGQQRSFDSAQFQDFFTFFLFFSPHGFKAEEGANHLLKRALTGSSSYSVGVSETLRDSVFVALRLCIEGFILFTKNQLDPVRDIHLCQQNSLIFLYRLLFILYAEDRGLLPYRRNATYTNNRSLAKLLSEVGTVSHRGGLQAYSNQQTLIWDYLEDLFDLINGGHSRYDVPAYNGGLFDPDKNLFLSTKRVSDLYLAQVLDKLSRTLDPLNPANGLFRVDYRDLAIQQLGSVYEGLLELEPHWASEEMVVCRSEGNRPEERIIPSSQSTPVGFQRTATKHLPNTVYLTKEKSERRATGSYYTPDHIVTEIVNRTLGPLCSNIAETLRGEMSDVEHLLQQVNSDEQVRSLHDRLQSLRAEYAKRVINLRVLDPAMGSGHFLLKACQFLAEDIATSPFSPDVPLDEGTTPEATLSYWKRQVVERSIYGVDLNPMAVELAKLALWLDTASSKQPLTFLDHHLRIGNSLIGGRVANLGVLPGSRPLLQNNYVSQVNAQLDRLLDPLARINALPSNTEQEVKEKDRIFRRAVLPIQQSFSRVADVWCSKFFMLPEQSVQPPEYEQLIQAMNQSAVFKRLLEQEPISASVALAQSDSIKPFHWEIEFPEVFFHNGIENDKGFDAIIGNPPYDVLADLELRRDLTGLKRFILADDTLAASRRGKNNLYKLFLCRGLELLKNGGYLGFIVPMPILGDDQALGVRRAFLEHGRFTHIDAFPQKDDPRRRVFRDAKLSTAVTIYRKGLGEINKSSKFLVRTHRANTLDTDSPELLLSLDDLSLYDAQNLPILTCSQDDWDLLARLLRSGHWTRLGTVATSHQGEVNETSDAVFITDDPADGANILRGANITLYQVRSASQGETKYLRTEAFHRSRTQSLRANHNSVPRIGFQRSSPQNNFRRIIAAPLPIDSYCFDTVSYVSKSETSAALNLLLGLLNSQLLDWYFRLGSTNSKVNEYQFCNLPFPVFNERLDENEHEILKRALDHLADNNEEDLIGAIVPLLRKHPYSLVIARIIEACVARIIEAEARRGEIPRSQRAFLDRQSQIPQRIIDRLIFQMAEFTEAESTGLQQRLRAML